VNEQFDVVIVGAGTAGLAALREIKSSKRGRDKSFKDEFPLNLGEKADLEAPVINGGEAAECE
jgi:predicted flavoprotein YhiN